MIPSGAYKGSNRLPEEGSRAGIASRRLTPVIVALACLGCPDFQPDPPPGPSPLTAGRVAANVTVEYRQPAHCANAPESCSNRVVFFASWMSPNDPGLVLDYSVASSPRFWTGVAHNVPVNWPPTDEPHYVRIYDPHLEDTPTGGATAARLTVGGQAITDYADLGTPDEAGRIYIDDNGVGRRPF